MTNAELIKAWEGFKNGRGFSEDVDFESWLEPLKTREYIIVPRVLLARLVLDRQAIVARLGSNEDLEQILFEGGKYYA
jgi:hypothetical protein